MRKALMNLLVVCFFTSCLGCGQQSAVDKPGQNPTDLSSSSTPFELSEIAAPLSSQEIELFLRIVRQLPGGRVPQFGRIELPAFEMDGQVERQLVKLKRTIRESLTPEKLAESWSSQNELLSALQQLEIRPVVFAGLCLKVSSSWARHRYSQQIVTLAVIDETELKSLEIAQVLNGYRLEGWDSEQLCKGLTEMAALTEFLKILAVIPQESLTTITMHAKELGTAIPGDEWMNPLAAKPDHHIQQVSW